MSMASRDPVIWTILVAAGEGRRFGGPKQLQPLGGRRVIDWAFDAAAAAGHGVVVVASADQVAAPAGGRGGPGALGAGPDVEVVVVKGGATRSESVRAGLAATPAAADVIVVHDAARPLAGGALFAAVIGAVGAGADGAVPAVAVTDTVRHTQQGALDRSLLRAVQTPQAFRADTLRRAHAGGKEATDDATLVEAAGGLVHLVSGEPDNLKITTPGDLALAEALLAASLRSETAAEGGGAGTGGIEADGTGAAAAGSPATTAGEASAIGVPLIGMGFDIHAFSDDPDRPLLLGGVLFEGERGLVGHSDADPVAHACCDAILGAAGLGDIGSLYPDDDERWHNADSIALLADAAERVRLTGRRIGNIDCTVVAESPRIAPRRAEMQARLSEAAGAPVTLKGKRAESLGALGRGEGIACWAVALLV